ncbi:hypothetical protein JOL62DRAFT_495686 [Phyllosticta paracitricarpa]|uniref:Polyketide synthase n=1 Tax=Phyllosticta paracitricarpa TaxID=2016321 RepID=A0ABR1NJP8_9PEZI
MSTSSTPKASSEASSPRLAASLSSHSSAPPTEDPSVIVGLACRVPGAQNYRQLWDHIVAQKDMRRKMPEDRFNVDNFYHVDGANKGTTNSKWGYFLQQDIGNFDPGFFGISGAEAEAMDPQQRLLLEVVYEALEDAGITLDEISGTQTSVYCGSFTNDYNSMVTKDLAHYPKYTVTGTGNAILSNRISYFYNLHGPSVTVDTACSSSLVCFHLGNRSLHNKEADISIVVGSSLHFDPNIFITMTDLGMLSTDGRCRAFDEKGSGYVRGEGICAVVLKRRSDAELSGDRIRAVVRTTGVNHDGRKQGITYPNTDAQEALIRATYENAGLDPAETQYFEAHGTGTKAGDPNETRAIGAVFAPNRSDNIFVGSVKTNIGHLEGASGLAAVVKTTMALEKAQIPPNMHFEDPNPAIKFSDWKITVPQKLMDWKPGPNGIRRASINSFGYGGTNAHVVLEHYQPPEPIVEAIPLLPEPLAPMVAQRPFLAPLSAHTDRAGKLQVAQLIEYLKERPSSKVADLVHSLSVRRTRHTARSFAIGKDIDELIKDMSEPPPVANWRNANTASPRLGFVFTGQGAQWFAMGRQLIQQSPLFKQTLEKCDRVLQSLPDRPDWSVIGELSRSKDDSQLGQTRFSQPICTALQLAIVNQLKAWGIEPSACVGHSSGEMGAAYASGILDFESAIIAAYYRGLYMSNSTEVKDTVQKKGAMMAVGLTEAECQVELEPYKGRVGIAAINSMSSITLSGDEDAIVEIKDKLTERKVFARQLQVAQAFHSHHMDPLAPGYERALADCPQFKTKEPSCRMFSSVTARLADWQSMGGKYWAQNMKGTVRFSDALTGILLDDEDIQNIDLLVEIGPHPALKGPSRQVIQSLRLEVPYLASLTRNEPDYNGLLQLAGQLFAHGYSVDLDAVNRDHFLSEMGPSVSVPTGTKLLDLPTYAWDHKRYWAETRYIKEHRQRKHRHSLLGAPVPGSVEGHPRWRNYLHLNELPWLSEHVVDGKTIFPGAGYICMAIEAAIRLNDQPLSSIKSVVLRDIVIKSALTLSDTAMGSEILLELKPLRMSSKSHSEVWHEFIVSSYEESGRCTEHCHGIVCVENGEPCAVQTLASYPSLEALSKETVRSVGRDAFYRHLDKLGLSYGENFRLLSGDLESATGYAIAPLTYKPLAVGSEEPYDATILHPSLLDAVFHVIFNAIESRLGRPLQEPYVPNFVRSLTVSGAFVNAPLFEDKEFKVCSLTELPTTRVATNDLLVYSKDADQLLVELQGLQVTSLGKDDEDSSAKRSLFFRKRWQPCFELIKSGMAISSLDSLAHVVDLFAHQYPDTQIFHLTTGVERTQDVLQTLGGTRYERRRFKNLEVFSPSLSAEQFDGLKEQRSGLIEFSEPKESNYDLVILSAKTDLNASSLVKAGGYVILDGVDAKSAQSNDLAQIFDSGSLSVWRKPEQKADIDGTVNVIMPEQKSEVASAVLAGLRKTLKVPVTTTTFPILAKDAPPAGNFVVLASLGDNFETPQFYEGAQALLKEEAVNAVWLTHGATMESTNPEHAMVIGLARVAHMENEQLRLVVVDLEDNFAADSAVETIAQALDPDFNEDELTKRKGVPYIPRVEADDSLNSKLRNGVGHEPRLEPFGERRPLALKIGKVGLLETLYFEEDEEILDNPLADDEIEIENKASAINFRDIASAMGIIEDYKLGDECAGIVIRTGSKVNPDDFKPGDRVVAWRPGQGAHRGIVRNPASLCWRLTGDMPFSAATALPLIITTAYYALVDVANMQPGENILIHGAMGGVGQMAVQLAQRAGCKVLATVGSQAKRDALKSKYGIPDDCIFSSRDDSFVEGVLKATDGRGADVVLNSLAGKLLHAAWNSMAPFGRFIEIGKRDIHENTKLDMDPFRKNVTFACVDLITIFELNKTLGARIFRKCCELVHEGEIQLPEVKEVSYADVQAGFRLLQMGKHMGKVVLVPHKDDLVPVLPPSYRNVNIFDPSKAYLLVGGLGGLGRTLAQWMVRKGAKHLVFLSRSGADRPEAKVTIEWLKKRDVAVDVYRGDVSNFADVDGCVQSIGNKLGGIFQAAMVLQDAPLEKMTFQQWQKCVQPKVNGTYNLHKASLGLSLDFFVCFSSVSGVIGSKAQANYAAANNYMDSLMRQRREHGLAGTTMNVGAIIGIGVVAEDIALQKHMERIRMDPVNEEELLYLLEEAVKSDKNEKVDSRGVDKHQIITGLNLSSKDVDWATKPLQRNLYANHDFNQTGNASGATMNLTAQLEAATTLEERTAILLEAFIAKVAAVLATPIEIIQASNPLSAYGLDSIVAVEFRKWFRKAVGVDIALFDVLSAKSINALVTKVAEMLATQTKSATAAAATESKGSKETEGKKDTQVVAKSSLGDIPVADKSQPVPLSTFQSRMWWVHNLAEDKSQLNLSIVLHLKGRPKISTLAETYSEIVRRDAILRTAYFEGDEFAEQEILDNVGFEMDFLDLSTQRDQKAGLEAFITESKSQELDIESGEIMRATLVKLGEDDFAIVHIFHHIMVDRGSTKAWLQRLVAIYDTLESNKDLSTVSWPSIGYADFAIWHNALLASPEFESEIRFWKDELAGAPEASKLLPFAKGERPTVDSRERALHKTKLNLNLLNRMKRICSQSNATPFHFLLAAFRAFYYRYTEDKDVTILMIDGSRPHPDLEDVTGFYVNMIPIRCRDECETSFDDLFASCRRRTLDAIAHKEVPFDKIVEVVQAKKTTSHFPIGQIAVNYQIHGEMPTFHARDFDIDNVESSDIPTACDLQLEALAVSDGLNLNLEYSTDLYGAEDMERFLDNFCTFLASCVKDHRQPVEEIDMSGCKELLHLKEKYWNTQYIENAWKEETVLTKILRAAQDSPNAIAINTSDGDSITYEKLVTKAQRIGAVLAKSGVEPAHRVAILSNPGVEAISSMLGVLLARSGYVALDPTFAVDRLAFMVSDSAAQVILVGEGLQSVGEEVVKKAGQSVRLVGIASCATEAMKLGQSPVSSPSDPFYMIYTSGSTGKPKGVVLTQSNTQAMLSTLQRDYEFSSSDKFLHQSSICFDLSIVQIFSALTTGATVCVASPETRKDPAALADFMRDEGVTVTYFTPTQFALLLEHNSTALRECKDYRVAYFAGERLPVRVAKAFYDLQTPATAYNTWSPSELIVQTTIHKVEYPGDDVISIPIGYPMSNCRHYIVDSRLHPLPAGMIGEIVVGGAQVGAGYLNRPEANAHSFVLDPWCSEEDRERGWTRMFRTGDKGRFRPDAQLEFHGRIAGDKQIKLRGFRIDLGEVEQQLYKQSFEGSQGLVDISVVARSDDDSGLVDNRKLIAFIVTKVPIESPAERAKYVTMLHERIAKNLNAYMLPSGYQFLDALPVTIGGKVDRQNLLTRKLDLVYPGSGIQQTSTTENSTQNESLGENETKVLQMIKDVVGRDTAIGLQDNFFAIGGNSILLLRLQSKVKRTFKTAPSMQQLLKNPTAEAICSFIQSGGKTPASKSRKVDDAAIDWEKESALPLSPKYQLTTKSSAIQRSAIRTVLVTGAESYIGIHLLATILSDEPNTTVHVLGSDEICDKAVLLQEFKTYGLLSEEMELAVFTRVRSVRGFLSKPRFGLSDSQFEVLGKSVQAIYHLGGHVNLLKNYRDLKQFNVGPVLDLIELSGIGGSLAEIHYLSTWSVPHLQAWVNAKLSRNSISAAEEDVEHFLPPATDDFGYFKTRWVAERLLTRAARRGFPVTIYRASAVTASSATKVPEPSDGFIGRMIFGMVDTGLIPADEPNKPGWDIDFIPVDVLATTMHTLATHAQLAHDDMAIFHIGNPRPLPLKDLAALLPQINPHQGEGRLIPLADWLERHANSLDEDGKLKWEVLRGYFSNGHTIFSLDRSKTEMALQKVGKSVVCPPVDGRYLSEVWERHAE